MKHVLIVYTGEFVTKFSPLSGIFQLEHALALKKSGIKVGVIAPCLLSVRRLLEKYPYKHLEKKNEIPILREVKKNFLPARINFYNYFLSLKYRKLGLKMFEKYVKKFGLPDLVHAHDIRFGIYVADEIHIKYKVPFLITENSSEIAEDLFPSILKNSSFKILKKAKIVSTVSKTFSKLFKKKVGLKNKEVKHFYPVLPFDFNQDKFVKKKKNKIYTFITINRFDNNKNIELIIRSFAYRFRNKKAILKIVGDGPNYIKLKKIALDLQISKKIFFIQNATRTYMKLHLRKSDCILSASYHETFGVVLIEALSYGIPAISTNSEGPSEIIHSKNGVIVKHRNYIEYANAMEKVYRDDYKFNFLKIKKDTLNRFGAKNFSNYANKIYNQCINKN